MTNKDLPYHPSMPFSLRMHYWTIRALERLLEILGDGQP